MRFRPLRGIIGEWIRLTDISNQLLHFSIGGDTNQKLKLVIGSIEPETADQDGENDSAHGINPPAQLTSTDRGQDTEPVNEEVIAVIFPEDADLGDLVAQGEAVDKEGELGAEGNDNSDDGGQMEIAGFRLGALDQFTDGEGDNDERDGRHEEAEADVTRRFDAGFAGGKLAGVDTVDGLIAEEQGEVGHGVEDGVGHCCEEGERARCNGTVEL